ncbi:MAG: hypothetical protein IT382_23930 [Deltaproteobacteria bacterium]|nr:hypothetical protein [Deltaproteobacteria bacterium]
MARSRTGRKKKRAPKAKAKARAKAVPKVRRRRPPRVKARSGPVQLWLPLQMPLGLSGGVVVEPVYAEPVEDSPAEVALTRASDAEQASLFE